MPTLSLKPTPQPVKAYYKSLAELHEGAVRSAFQVLLEARGRQVQYPSGAT